MKIVNNNELKGRGGRFKADTLYYLRRAFFGTRAYPIPIVMPSNNRGDRIMLLVRSCVFVLPFAEFLRNVRALVCIGFNMPCTTHRVKWWRTSHTRTLPQGGATLGTAGGRRRARCGKQACVLHTWLDHFRACYQLPLPSRTLGGTYAAPQHHIAWSISKFGNICI